MTVARKEKPNNSPVHNQVFARFKITRWQTLLVEASRGALHEQRRHLTWGTLKSARVGAKVNSNKSAPALRPPIRGYAAISVDAHVPVEGDVLHGADGARVAANSVTVNNAVRRMRRGERRTRCAIRTSTCTPCAQLGHSVRWATPRQRLGRI